MKFSLVLLSVVASAMADMANNHVKRDHHAHAAALHKKDVTPEQVEKRNEDENLVKRDSYSGVATYYDVTPNAGACGDWMQNTDWVVALNSPQLQAYGGYQNGKPTSCYRSITIQAYGTTANAVIKDECPSCGWGSLDLSPSLFQHFTVLDTGVFPITWWFDDDGSGGGSQPQPTTTSQWTPDPTTTWTPPPPTTTWTPPTTSSTPTTTTSSTPSTTSTTSTTPTTTSSSQDTAQEAPPTSTPPANLNNINLAAVQMGAFIQAAAAL